MNLNYKISILFYIDAICVVSGLLGSSSYWQVASSKSMQRKQDGSSDTVSASTLTFYMSPTVRIDSAYTLTTNLYAQISIPTKSHTQSIAIENEFTQQQKIAA